MKQIITNKAVAYDAVYPTQTSIILFDNIRMKYDTKTEILTFFADSYKVIDDANGVYEHIRTHTRMLTKAEIDALYTSLTITATNWTDRTNEELVKAYAYVINDEGIFGLVTADLILR